MSRPATSRLKVNPPLGVMPTLQFCLLGQLQVDEAYQRSLAVPGSQTLIRQIAMFWNWDLCQPLVVARRDDGALFVVDGQHRLAAARLRSDIPQLPCVIASYASTADEAASFVALNQQRRPLNALDIFRATVAAEDDVALAVVAALADHGLSVAPHWNCSSWKPGMVSNVAAIAAAWRRDGPELTRLALRVMSLAYPGQVLQYCGTVFGGVIGAARARPALDAAALAVRLAHLGQNGLRNAVMRHRADNPNTKYSAAAAAVVLGLVEAPRTPTEKPAPLIERRIEPTPVTVTRAPSALRKPVVAPVTDTDKRWCEQCDRQISVDSVRFCMSKFCSLRKRS